MEPGDPINLKNKNVTMVGFGRSGRAAVRLLLNQGAQVSVTDRRPESEIEGSMENSFKGRVQMFFGGHPKDAFKSAELVVTSPGVRPGDIPGIQAAKMRGVSVIGEVELAFRFLDCPVIGVTGSNGKSTTTVLTAAILEKAGKKVFAGGNLGPPLCEALTRQESDGPWDWVVAELSSFQLETIDTFRPKVGVILNILPNHLDRYSGMESYGEAKWRLFENQTEEDWAVVNADDPLLLKRGGALRSRKIFYSRENQARGGFYFDDGWLVSEWAASGGRSEAVEKFRVLPREDVRLTGDHNLENVLAATAAGMAAGCPKEAVREAVSVFKGLEHRLEAVSCFKGVFFVNDSKATTVSALSRALHSFGSPVILISGGRDKGGGFEAVRNVVEEKVKTAVLIGESRPALQKAWGGASRLIEAEDMFEAVQAAFRAASEGDVVLLSPACASFDMYTDFEERGRCFKEAVKELEKGTGKQNRKGIIK